MNRFLLLLIFIFLTVIPSYSQIPALKIEATLENPSIILYQEDPVLVDTTLTGRLKFSSAQFTVNTVITNISDEVQVIRDWGCLEGKEWVVDHPAFEMFPYACPSNRYQDVSLKPHQKYKGGFRLAALENISVGDVQFRVGYQPDLIPNWSQPVVLTVEDGDPLDKAEWQKMVVHQREFMRLNTVLPIKDGIARRYYYTGELNDERAIKDGQLDGVTKQYFKDGVLKSEIPYKQNRYHGEAKYYYESGQLKKSETYRNGRRIEFTSYDEDGNILP